MNGQDPDSGGESAGDVARADRAGRQDVVIRKFTVEPPAIVTGGNVTVSWHVVFAETVDAELHLNGQLVTTIGHKAFTPTQTTTFTLSIVFPNGAERKLASRGVRVDPVDCQEKGIGSSFIINPLKTEFDNRFRVLGQLSLRDNGSTVTLGDNQIKIVVPAEINVPSLGHPNAKGAMAYAGALQAALSTLA